MLYSVSIGIALGIIIHKFFFAGTFHQRVEWLKNTLSRWYLYVIPFVGVAIIKWILYSPVQAGSGPYTEYAGRHGVSGVLTDKYGNPEGSQFDLAKDNSFEGQKISVLHLYTGEGFDFSLPEEALKTKGFKIHRWTSVPEATELAEEIESSCQVWLIATTYKLLNENHLKVIKEFFDRGGGLYVWGDNEPYYQDANYITEELFGISMQGDTPGDQVVTLQEEKGGSGFISHLITTGIEYLYEGITIATLRETSKVKPLIYGSAGNLIAAIYDKDGKRAIIDGGFTRLFYKWDTAGTGRYVKNAAAWLANSEITTTYERVKTNEPAVSFPLWKRVLGWGAWGFLIGLTTGLGDKRTKMIKVAPIGGFFGGIMSAIIFAIISAGGSLSRFISFALIGACIGLTIFIVELVYSKLVSPTRFDFSDIRPAKKE